MSTRSPEEAYRALQRLARAEGRTTQQAFELYVHERFLALPGRLVRSARRTTLRMPARWPWADGFLAALARLRALPPPN